MNYNNRKIEREFAVFGYLRPNQAELLVKDQELYRAVYCGLCRTMRRKVSFFASLSLNYDFVLIALLLAELTGETFRFCLKRCPVHPLKRRSCANIDSEALYRTALIHLALTYEKLRDDRLDADVPLKRRILVWLYSPLLGLRVHILCKRNEEFARILSHASRACEELRACERRGECDLDTLAHVCSEGIARACSVGLDGSRADLMYRVCATLGRLTYLLDAADDLCDDAKKGSFNPFLQKYGSLDEACKHSEEIGMALALYAEELDRITNLITQPARYDRLCDNITQKGIPTSIHRVMMKLNTESRTERKQA